MTGCKCADMEEEVPGDSSPSPCHLENCDDEVYLACPTCTQFVCYQHIDDHSCRGPQLQIVKQSSDPLNVLQVLLILRMLINMLQPSRLQKIIASFSPESLSKLSLNQKFYDYITSNELWKKYCFFPKLYWKESENIALLEKQHFEPFSIWKYNYDHEFLLQKNWGEGVATITKLKLMKRRTIKKIKASIDSFGKHWLFLIDGITIQIWDVSNTPRLHYEIWIKKYVHPKIKIVLSNEKLFLIWGNFVKVYAFRNPDYSLKFLYSIFCDKDFTIRNNFSQITGALLFKKNLQHFCVHVLDNFIIGHTGYTKSKVLELHIWNSNTGSKIGILVFNFPLSPNPTDRLEGYMESKVCPLGNDFLIKAVIYLNGESDQSFLIITDVTKAITHHFSFFSPRTSTNGMSLWNSTPALPMHYSHPGLNKLNATLPQNIVYWRKISEYEIIMCVQQNRELKFCVFGIKGGQLNEVLCRFTMPLNKRALFPIAFRIYLFEAVGLLCVAVEYHKIKVIDLKSISQGNLETKTFCKVNDVKKLYFINPKYVLILSDMKGVGEIWDIEKGISIGSESISDEFICAQVSWHDVTFVPPTKVFVAIEHNVYILDFEPK